ncbi:hypothetical protein [Cellulosilyticum ruminicola]|uniref:hypothetical protein n=1 Tax=Cellulosilyticum ruminicola TaxID=425254 RepID=UPI0006D167E5|nr:hypothetical protein [Cellulosilyticum ruminicola]
MDIMGIIRTQKVAGKIAIRREHRNQQGQYGLEGKNKNLFILNEIVEEKSDHIIAKEIRREQVVDIMQGMKMQSISRITHINNAIKKIVIKKIKKDIDGYTRMV